MWAKGRYDTPSSSAKAGFAAMSAPAMNRMLRCDSMAPFGGPVVPEV